MTYFKIMSKILVIQKGLPYWNDLHMHDWPFRRLVTKYKQNINSQKYNIHQTCPTGNPSQLLSYQRIKNFGSLRLSSDQQVNNHRQMYSPKIGSLLVLNLFKTSTMLCGSHTSQPHILNKNVLFLNSCLNFRKRLFSLLLRKHLLTKWKSFMRRSVTLSYMLLGCISYVSFLNYLVTQKLE